MNRFERIAVKIISSVIKLVDWQSSNGKYLVVVSINGKNYTYNLNDKMIFDEIRREAVYHPGKALDIAKKHHVELEKLPDEEKISYEEMKNYLKEWIEVLKK